MPDDTFLSERGWKSLLREIHLGNVIPVVGPGLVLAHPSDGSPPIPLQQQLAPVLARDLGVPIESVPPPWSFNAVARAFLLGGGKRSELYIALGEIIERLTVGPSKVLLDLAGITDFSLYIASTPDPLLAHAVAQARPGFSTERGVIRFHPAGNPNRTQNAPLSGSVAAPCDLPDVFKGPLVYHILGDYTTLPDFAVCEEDYMEFICGLLENRDTLENLFRLLGSRNLLLLGAPSDDWIVRFFLRAASGKRLSEGKNDGYIVDQHERLGEPMIFFFDKAVQRTRIIDGAPDAFVRALATRWREAYGTGEADAEAFLKRQPDELPRGSVFLSYSRDDLAVAVRVAQALVAGGVPVWMDRQRLQAGESYGRAIEGAVKHGCSYFVSLISRTTDGDTDRARYVHRERDWAAQRHVDGFVFYLPLLIDETRSLEREPACFRKLQNHKLAELPAFVTRVRSLVDQYRDSERPRA